MKPRRHGRSASVRPVAWVGLLMLAACYDSLNFDSLKCRPGVERNCPEGFECRISGAAEKGRCCPIGDLACGVADAALDAPTSDQSRMDVSMVSDSDSADSQADADPGNPADAGLDVPVTGEGGAGGTGGHKAETGVGGAGGQGSFDASTDAPLGAGGASSTGGVSATGGRVGTGGVTGTGGLAATGGIIGTGGAGTGGVNGTGGTPGSGGTGTGGASGTGGSTGCAHGQVAANEVLWIGDNWLQMPNGSTAVPTVVRDLARGAETIGPTEAYADRSISGQGIASIVFEYTKAPQGFKVLLMDGGCVDLQHGTQLDGGTDIAVETVSGKFQELLVRAAAVGSMQHIVFVLIPEAPGVPGIGPGLTALRPLLQQSCATSQVPCHFIDLQPLFAGRMSSLLSDLVNPNADGARVIGQAIWKVMQDNCIAQ